MYMILHTPKKNSIQTLRLVRAVKCKRMDSSCKRCYWLEPSPSLGSGFSKKKRKEYHKFRIVRLIKFSLILDCSFGLKGEGGRVERSKIELVENTLILNQIYSIPP